MELVTEEIEKARKTLNLAPSACRKLPDDETDQLYNELLELFVEGGDRRWWWESFIEKTSSVALNDDGGFKHLVEFVPNPEEKVWFVVEEDHLPCYPIYEATTSDAVKVIGECYAFEYYLVPKSKLWLLCENHHGRVIGVGDEVRQRIEAFEKDLK